MRQVIMPMSFEDLYDTLDTINKPEKIEEKTCCDDPLATNYDPNCSCIDNSTCFTVPDG